MHLFIHSFTHLLIWYLLWARCCAGHLNERMPVSPTLEELWAAGGGLGTSKLIYQWHVTRALPGDSTGGPRLGSPEASCRGEAQGEWVCKDEQDWAEDREDGVGPRLWRLLCSKYLGMAWATKGRWLGFMPTFVFYKDANRWPLLSEADRSSILLSLTFTSCPTGSSSGSIRCMELSPATPQTHE